MKVWIVRISEGSWEPWSVHSVHATAESATQEAERMENTPIDPTDDPASWPWGFGPQTFCAAVREYEVRE